MQTIKPPHAAPSPTGPPHQRKHSQPNPFTRSLWVSHAPHQRARRRPEEFRCFSWGSCAAFSPLRYAPYHKPPFTINHSPFPIHNSSRPTHPRCSTTTLVGGAMWVSGTADKLTCSSFALRPCLPPLQRRSHHEISFTINHSPFTIHHSPMLNPTHRCCTIPQTTFHQHPSPPKPPCSTPTEPTSKTPTAAPSFCAVSTSAEAVNCPANPMAPPTLKNISTAPKRSASWVGRFPPLKRMNTSADSVHGALTAFASSSHGKPSNTQGRGSTMSPT